MRNTLVSFLVASLFVLTSCGKASETTDETESDDQTTTTSTDTSADDASGSQEGDASAVSNSSVTSKPLFTSCYKGDSFACEVEAAIVKETNAVRGSRTALTHDFESSFVARDWSQTQADAGNISHDGFPYDRVKALKQEFPNASWGYSAENVGKLSTSESEAATVGKAFVTMWKNSEGHKKNMLGSYTYIGAGVARVGNNLYATQIFH